MERNRVPNVQRTSGTHGLPRRVRRFLFWGQCHIPWPSGFVDGLREVLCGSYDASMHTSSEYDATDKQIDRLVYELTDDEIRIVEEATEH